MGGDKQQSSAASGNGDNDEPDWAPEDQVLLAPGVAEAIEKAYVDIEKWTAAIEMPS